MLTLEPNDGRVYLSRPTGFLARPRLRVLGLNDRYHLYVRHYSESIRETVMFFIPRMHGGSERSAGSGRP